MKAIRMRSRCLVLAVTAAATLAACSPVKLIDALVPRTGYSAHTALPYESGDRHALDVYVPTSSASADTPRPLVVFFYGGSWQTGDRRDYRFVGEALASRGYVTVIPDYRLYPDTIFPGFIEDAAAAVDWAHTHAADFGADPQHMFLMGHSAGAQIVMLLATDRHYLMRYGIDAHSLAGAIGLAGPYDFLPLRDENLKTIFPAELREDSQPINHVNGSEPPIWLGVGTADRTVDPGNTTRFAARLESAHDRFTLERYTGVNHAIIVGSLARPIRALSSVITVAPVLDDVSAFIDAHSGDCLPRVLRHRARS
ncbi:alpha/beta hydrolase [Paraburkholderia hospita]|uniref:Alpha/beta hydrolase n=1 Tax=Paraburkholderia hospita TaxID=169430 RepID=A0AAN1JBW9_9BURK|nr:alpha/beta hydrolase [Paraburkholderia hospita]AUT70860.1 alpha/beta hydrolase [Paraburkholderia hospita]EIM93614.1 alpha/beta hydrolase family protein [Paraburkholderia hospita]OUL71689.1 carboxylesterase [Paraburkholderia hospita]OUL93820.1 carboxylesterase [Paraburkholderia hospita]SEI25874.1 Acetyl esterase/lipase [Paraburkholderia hospita]